MAKLGKKKGQGSNGKIGINTDVRVKTESSSIEKGGEIDFSGNDISGTSTKDQAEDNGVANDVVMEKEGKEAGGPSVFYKLGHVLLPYKKKFDLLTAKYNELQKKTDEDAIDFEKTKSELEGKIASHEETIKALSRDNANHLEKIGDLNKTLTESNTENSQLKQEKRGVEEKLRTAVNELAKAKNDISEAFSTITHLNTDLEQERRNAKQQQSSQSIKFSNQNSELMKRDDQIRSLSSDIKTIEGENAALKNLLKDRDGIIVSLRKEKENLHQSLMEAKEELDKFKALNPDTAEIMALRDELSRLKESREEDLKNHESALQVEFEKTIEVREQRLNAEKEAAVEEAKKPFISAIEELDEKLKKAKEENTLVRNNAKQRLEDLKTKQFEEIKVLEERHKQNLQQQLDSYRSRHEAEVKTLTAGYEDKIKKGEELLEKERREATAALNAEKLSAKQKLEAKDAEISNVKAKADEEKAKLSASRKAEQDRADSLYSRLEGQLKWILGGIVADLKDAWPEGKEGAPGVIVDDILSQNDMITLNEYVTDFVEPALESVQSKSNDELDNALNKVYNELLSPKRPTWLDSLLRLDALVRVPFIASQFSSEGLDVQKVQRAADKATALLAFNGITVDVPKLFSDIFDRDKHEAQPIKDISTQVDDVASHVKDPETLIDIFTIGYHSADGSLSRRPAVSRLNA